jgi:radical SAM superfamily enzyme YgiQ (UPF0313 family)
MDGLLSWYDEVESSRTREETAMGLRHRPKHRIRNEIRESVESTVRKTRQVVDRIVLAALVAALSLAVMAMSLLYMAIGSMDR